MSINRSIKSLIKKTSSAFLKKEKLSQNIIITDDALEHLKTQNSDDNLPVLFRGHIRGVINGETGCIEIESKAPRPDVRQTFGLFDNNQKIKKKTSRPRLEKNTFKNPEDWSDWTDEASSSKKTSNEGEKTSVSSHSKSV